MTDDRTRARRDAVRRLHPDRGGDGSELSRVLAEIDARFVNAVVREPRKARPQRNRRRLLRSLRFKRRRFIQLND